jgi:hypothetical protein
MGQKETTLKEVGEMLAYVVEHMATKDDLKEFREETAEIAPSTRKWRTFGAISKN